jgi:hypothetical protein
METTLEVRGAQIERTADELSIQDVMAYGTAGEVLKVIKSLRGQISETFDPIIQKAHQTHKEALQAKGKHEAPLDHAEKVIKGKVLEYIEKERERAAAEKARLEAAEQARIEDERLKTAQEFTDAGLPEEADRFLSAPVVVQPSKVEAEATLDGVHTMERATAEVVDFLALVRSVALGNTPSDCLATVPAVLNAWARAGWAPPGVGLSVVRSVVVKG